MNCAICAKQFNNAEFRLRLELKGICLDCAKKGDFYDMTDEEIDKCFAVLKAITDYENMTSAQHQHQTDMGR
ncbi:hypothetical protein UFOVP1506_8 [uncultured Caudovirales phage]|uniref:Uncharacterized protein n=1 Tax=uncultured Caudovirales phage TaxID=2100421 RepID=A0A6J5S5H8_9CAUD|nr:hypothetical protein UFOVP292_8 [uncultured Caudovirales phage]CAB4149542.1 hypothetical protein UFOVP559_20 [uncultured Caudovirales phage]CAB4168329.1 hypothetical protein UFOVP880_15 [uncultured Caudovirales phage]CAB4180122.1 hypothetical protein UFOVP1055_7 [uncultured Caudovirales phage]CAB4194867.1 hypothetical protein UFOVP1270_7 [uncultured Caudovirales phage]